MVVYCYNDTKLFDCIGSHEKINIYPSHFHFYYLFNLRKLALNMPANPKYLTKSPWQKIAKISAGILGGYIITSLLHMILAIYIPFHNEVLITSIFSLSIVWCALLIIPYLFKNGWKAWGVYIISVILLYLLYFFANRNNPFI